MSRRPAVSVIVPFLGAAADARALAEALTLIDTAPGDELIVADNTEDGTFHAAVADRRLRAVAAPLERSSYYARNVGVEASANDWLLFIDSDCRPEPGVLDAFFAPAPDDGVGILSGGVAAAAGQRELIARYAASRRHIDPGAYLETPGRRPAGITANLLVRRAAWEAVSGFHEGVRSGADLEFCWRVQDAGWALDRRPHARVEHEHVRTLAALRRKTIRHAGGGGWVNEHHPGAFRRPPLARQLGRCAVGVVAWTAVLRPRRGLFKGIDAIFLTFDAYGRLTGNRAPRDAARRAPRTLIVVARRWSDATDPSAAAAVRALAARAPGPVAVEALGRPQRPDRCARRDVRTTYAEDDGVLRRLADLAWLVARRPAAVLADRLAPRPASAVPLARLAPLVRRVRAAGPGATVVTLRDSALAARVGALSGRAVEDVPGSAGARPAASAAHRHLVR